MDGSWSDLGWRARAWRIVHASWSLAQLAALGLIWHRVLTRRRDPAVWASAAFLAVEGGALIVGRGNCPMGQLQEGWGDPVPFFELLLPPMAAKAAVPVLAGVSIAALSALVLRRPGIVMRSNNRDQAGGTAGERGATTGGRPPSSPPDDRARRSTRKSHHGRPGRQVGRRRQALGAADRDEASRGAG